MRNTLSAIAITSIALFGVVTPATAQAYTPHTVCEYEDGNTNGTPCTWTNPRTGIAYDVDSRNYWPQEDEPGWDCRTMGNRICGL